MYDLRVNIYDTKINLNDRHGRPPIYLCPSMRMSRFKVMWQRYFSQSNKISGSLCIKYKIKEKLQ